MPTSSLYHNVVIDTDEAAERLLDALENPTAVAVDPAAYMQLSGHQIKALFLDPEKAQEFCSLPSGYDKAMDRRRTHEGETN